MATIADEVRMALALRDDARRVRVLISQAYATNRCLNFAERTEIEGVCKDMEIAATVLERHVPTPEGKS